MQDGVNGHQQHQDDQDRGLDGEALHAVQEAWRAHTSHNTRDCRRYNKDGTPIKKNGGAGKPHSKKAEGANFTQIIQAELKKALCKKAGKHKKRREDDSDSDSDSDYST